MTPDESIKKLNELAGDPQKMTELVHSISLKIAKVAGKDELIENHTVELGAFALGIAVLSEQPGGLRAPINTMLLLQSLGHMFLLGAAAAQENDLPAAFKEAFK